MVLPGPAVLRAGAPRSRGALTGDVLPAEEGDTMPADARVIESTSSQAGRHPAGGEEGG